MTNNLKIILAFIIIIIIGIFIYFQKPKSAVVVNEPVVETPSSIAGCYKVNSQKDVYTLTILSHEGDSFKGNLVFKNFEKDSSSGSFNGTYKDGILLGDYSFASEGTNSVIQVIFKKEGNDFVRGYGDVNKTGDRFVDVNKITYDSSSNLSVFKASDCESFHLE